MLSSLSGLLRARSLFRGLFLSFGLYGIVYVCVFCACDQLVASLFQNARSLCSLYSVLFLRCCFFDAVSSTVSSNSFLRTRFFELVSSNSFLRARFFSVSSFKTRLLLPRKQYLEDAFICFANNSTLVSDQYGLSHLIKTIRMSLNQLATFRQN